MNWPIEAGRAPLGRERQVQQLDALEAVGGDVGLEELEVLGVGLEGGDARLGEPPLEPGDGEADVAAAVEDDGGVGVAGELVLPALEDLVGEEVEFGGVPVLEGEAVHLSGLGAKAAFLAHTYCPSSATPPTKIPRSGAR